MVTARFHIINPVFNQNLTSAEVGARLSSVKANYAIATRNDPAWIGHATWLFETPAVFSTPHVRVIDVSAIGQKISAQGPSLLRNPGAPVN
jgi:hypothetical protein